MARKQKIKNYRAKILPSTFPGVNWKVFIDHFEPFTEQTYLGGFKLKTEAKKAIQEWERNQKRWSQPREPRQLEMFPNL